MPARLWLHLFLLLTLLLPACDDRPPSGPIPVHPVTGQVLYKGKPVANAVVAFHQPAVTAPAPGSAGKPSTAPNPTATTDSEGKFKMRTYVGTDGAPVGDYLVLVTLSAPSDTRNIMAKSTATGATYTIHPKYQNPQTSGLTATIKEGENTLQPFELK